MSKRTAAACTAAFVLGLGFLGLTARLSDSIAGVDITELSTRQLWLWLALMSAPLLAGVSLTAALTLFLVARGRARRHAAEPETMETSSLGAGTPEMLEL